MDEPGWITFYTAVREIGGSSADALELAFDGRAPKTR